MIDLHLPAAEYHKREFGVVSNSALTRVDRSPAHYKAWIDGHEKTTDALAFGTAFHMAMLEPARFLERYIVEPNFGDCRYKDNKTKRDAWRADNAGRTSIEQDDYDCLVGMMESMQRHPAAARLLVGGHQEVSLRWVDSVSGLQCKARADYWIPEKRIVVDLKSTEDASPEGFARSVAKYRYHVQDALYGAGFGACGQLVEHFAFVAVEKEPPYAVAVYLLDGAAIAKGREVAASNIETLRACMESGEWVAYSNGVQDLSLPRWAA